MAAGSPFLQTSKATSKDRQKQNCRKTAPGKGDLFPFPMSAFPQCREVFGTDCLRHSIAIPVAANLFQPYASVGRARFATFLSSFAAFLSVCCLHPAVCRFIALQLNKSHQTAASQTLHDRPGQAHTVAFHPHPHAAHRKVDEPCRQTRQARSLFMPLLRCAL